MKDYMTVKGGVGPKDGERIYRDLKKEDKDIIYIQYKGLLFRDILDQDVDLIREANRGFREACTMLVRDQKTGQFQLMSADKIYDPPTDKEILERIRGIDREKGKCSIAVFEHKTKQFIALLDVETLENTEFKECAVEFMFAKNKLIQRAWGNKVKKYFVEICKESGLFINGCVEKINHGDHYQLREIPT